MVADDHPFFRDGVIRGLTMSGRVEVVAEADDGREALEAIRRERPDVALVDHEMPDVDGLGVVRATVRDGLPTRVLLLSAHTDSGIVFQALEAGAAGYLSKDARRAEIVEAVLDVARGKTVLPPGVAAGLAGEIRLRAQSSGPALSERERQVLQGFARGLSVPQVAAELFLGASTVKTHTQRLYEKLGVLRPCGRGGGGHAPGSGRVTRSAAPTPQGGRGAGVRSPGGRAVRGRGGTDDQAADRESDHQVDDGDRDGGGHRHPAEQRHDHRGGRRQADDPAEVGQRVGRRDDQQVGDAGGGQRGDGGERQSRPALPPAMACAVDVPTGAYSTSTRITRVPTRATSAATAAVARPPVHSRVASGPGRRSAGRVSRARYSAGRGSVTSGRRTVSSEVA